MWPVNQWIMESQKTVLLLKTVEVAKWQWTGIDAGSTKVDYSVMKTVNVSVWQWTGKEVSGNRGNIIIFYTPVVTNCGCT